MIYLDSAATSLLKPRTVHAAMLNAMRTMASPAGAATGPRCSRRRRPMTAAPCSRTYFRPPGRRTWCSP